MPCSLPISRAAVEGALACVLIAVSACSSQPPPAALAQATPASIASPAAGLVLAEPEGERRIRRSRPGGQRDTATPVIIKVDGTNGGSSQLFMGYTPIGGS